MGVDEGNYKGNNTEPVENTGTAKVLRFVARPPSRREPPATDEEIREYRRNKARLMKMLDEWEAVRTHCPLARKILEGG
jgi:hypothetical protein